MPVKKKFAVASQLHIPPYNWIPPESPPLLATPNPEEFDADMSERCKVFDDPNIGSLSTSQDPFHGRPDPAADFSHFIDGEEGFTAIQNNPAKKQKNDEALLRLRLAFDFLVCRTRDLCVEINEGVKFYDTTNDQTWGRYLNARQTYIEFLQNLDDHEPKANLKKADLDKGLGYGKHYRWLFVDPTIEEVEIIKGSVKPLITGAIIVLLWNPHSSSSGIPIKHP